MPSINTDGYYNRNNKINTLKETRLISSRV